MMMMEMEREIRLDLGLCCCAVPCKLWGWAVQRPLAA